MYDSKHYFLESDTKITDTRQRSGARLVCVVCVCNVIYNIFCLQSSFLLVDNYVWAGSLFRTIYILDSDTSTGVLCMMCMSV